MKMVMMQCTRPFAEGKIRVTVNGQSYQFQPNRRGDSVCAVREVDVFTLKNVSAAYREYDRTGPKAKRPAAVEEPDNDDASDNENENEEGTDDVVDEASPAFLEPSNRPQPDA